MTEMPLLEALRQFHDSCDGEGLYHSETCWERPGTCDFAPLLARVAELESQLTAAAQAAIVGTTDDSSYVPVHVSVNRRVCVDVVTPDGPVELGAYLRDMEMRLIEVMRIWGETICAGQDLAPRVMLKVEGGGP